MKHLPKGRLFKTMRLSKKKINPRLAKQIFNLFYQVVADFRSPQEAETFFKALLTQTELEAITKRLGVAYYLTKGRTYDNIKKNLGVSSATVAKIQDQLNQSNGYNLALKKIQADEWADKWAKRIKKMMGRNRK